MRTKSQKHNATFKITAIILSLFLLFSITNSFQSVKATEVDSLNSKGDNLKKDAKRLEKIISEQETTFADLEAYKNALLDKQKNAREQIDTYDKQIKGLDLEIKDLNGSIEISEDDINGLEESIDLRFATLQSRLLNVNKKGFFSDFELIIDAPSYKDYLVKTKMLERISEHDNRLIEDLNRDLELVVTKKENLSLTKEQLSKRVEKLSGLKKESEDQESELKTIEQKNDNLISEVGLDIYSNTEELSETKEELDKIESDIQDIIKKALSTSTLPPTTTTQPTTTAPPSPGNTNDPSPGGSNSTTTTAKTTTTTKGGGQSGGAFNGKYLLWPVPHTRQITSEYGWRWGKLHKGIDIASWDISGKQVVATANGTVIWANHEDSWGGGYGHFIMIDHGYGVVTLSAHNSKLLVRAGDNVTAGTPISIIGNTGNSTGPHLHFEVRVGETPVDPFGAKYLKR